MLTLTVILATDYDATVPPVSAIFAAVNRSNVFGHSTAHNVLVSEYSFVC